MFQVGDQVATKWTDRVPATPVEYDNPFDIVQNDVKAILQDGEEVDAITIMQHYTTPRDMPFDAREAAFVFLTAGSAGTYYFKMQEQPWCSGDVGKYITFTLTTAPPAGAQLVMNQSYNATAVGATISLYADGSATTPLETVTMSEGQTGTDLGALTVAGRNESTGVNSIHCALLGYNRWSQSNVRQWLNSKKTSGWYTPQSVFDRPPADTYLNQPGYMSGFADDFLAVIKKTRVRTALNTVTDSSIGTYEDTYDYFFLPSLQEINAQPQLADVEGGPWPYWKQATGLSGYNGWYDANKNPAYLIYALNAKTSAQYVRLRSAFRGYAYLAWFVYAAGYISNIYAFNAYRSTPACRITADSEAEAA